MQGIMEGIFDTGYLITALLLGFIIFLKSKSKASKIFGIMTLILAFGDSFHLVPRVIGLNTTGLENFVFSLGLGKLVTSITMTVYYVLFYLLIEIKTNKKNNTLKYLIYSFAFIRILLCCFPQNGWFVEDSSYIWGILRNIPFLILGALVVYSLFKYYPVNGTKYAIAVILSFIFYLLVVLFADKLPIIGMMMLPKTICYMYIMILGYKEYRN